METTSGTDMTTLYDKQRIREESGIIIDIEKLSPQSQPYILDQIDIGATIGFRHLSYPFKTLPEWITNTSLFSTTLTSPIYDPTVWDEKNEKCSNLFKEHINDFNTMLQTLILKNQQTLTFSQFKRLYEIKCKKKFYFSNFQILNQFSIIKTEWQENKRKIQELFFTTQLNDISQKSQTILKEHFKMFGKVDVPTFQKPPIIPQFKPNFLIQKEHANSVIVKKINISEAKYNLILHSEQKEEELTWKKKVKKLLFKICTQFDKFGNCSIFFSEIDVALLICRKFPEHFQLRKSPKFGYFLHNTKDYSSIMQYLKS